jgi:prepilin-type N-terminal cleavage/methylation domain-containing protein
MRRGNRRLNKGFTLVELLIVTALMGLVAMAIFTLYRTTSRTAATSDEVIEVQQNLRIAMDQITRDLRMAGFMTPPLNDAFLQADATSLTLVTATATGRAARIDQDLVTDGSAELDFTVALEEMVDLFVVDDTVRVLRPPNQGEPIGQVFNVTGVNRNNRRLSLDDFSGSVAVEYLRGDMIVQTTAAAPNPNTVQYCLGPAADCGSTVATCPVNQNCLMRILNGTAAVVAGNIAPDGLTFTYFLENGNQTVAPADLGQIRALRVELTGQTVTTVPLSDGQAKTRTITSVVKLRNR